MQADTRRRATAWCALVPVLALLIGASPAVAESRHWGGGVVRFSMSSDGIPLSTEKPGRTSWSFSPTQAVIGVWHREAEVTAGEATVFGSFSGQKENTLGGTGTASFTFPAPVAGRPFTASATGTFVRTQALIQVDLLGAATDGNGEVVPVRITGHGTWRPTAGDGTLEPITRAEVILTFVFIFPGDTPPPGGPKAASVLDFEGTANLPVFPCPPPLPGEPLCSGTFSGMQEAFLAGDAGPGAWALQMAAPISASFNYANLIEPGVPCLEELASGVGTSEGGHDDVLGFWTDRLGLIKTVIGAQVSFSFDWRREGLTTVVTLRDLSVRLHTQGMGWVEVVAPGSSTGPLAAVFLPQLERAHLDACEQGEPGPALSATVNGFGTIDGF